MGPAIFRAGIWACSLTICVDIPGLGILVNLMPPEVAAWCNHEAVGALVLTFILLTLSWFLGLLLSFFDHLS